MNMAWAGVRRIFRAWPYSPASVAKKLGSCARQADQPTGSRDKSTGATAVLAGWHQDPHFTDSAANPSHCPLVRLAVSFLRLCDRYAGDIPAAAMLKELRRVGAVVKEDGRLRVTTRNYVPGNSDTQWVMSAAETFQDLGDNLSYNLDAGSDTPTRFLGRAINSHVKAGDVPAFQEFLEEHGQAFLEKIDDWLADHAAETDSNAEQVRLGVGLFAIEGLGDRKEDENNG